MTSSKTLAAARGGEHNNLTHHLFAIESIGTKIAMKAGALRCLADLTRGRKPDELAPMENGDLAALFDLIGASLVLDENGLQEQVSQLRRDFSNQ